MLSRYISPPCRTSPGTAWTPPCAWAAARSPAQPDRWRPYGRAVATTSGRRAARGRGRAGCTRRPPTSRGRRAGSAPWLRPRERDELQRVTHVADERAPVSGVRDVRAVVEHAQLGGDHVHELTGRQRHALP